MKRTDLDEFDSIQAAIAYEKSKSLNLEEYCNTLGYSKADTINFEEWAKKGGFGYDEATKANWNFRYEKFKKGETELFGKKKEEKKDSFLGKAQKFLKECYDKGAVIEYEESEGKWVDLPKGLPIDFTKFDEGKIRLKFNDPTYEQVMEFKSKYGAPIVTDWDFKNIPMLAFCYNKGFCGIRPEPTIGKRLEWYPIAIWRYYDKKEYLPETPVEELQKIFEKTETEEHNKMEYSVAVGNPAEKQWDEFTKRANGSVVGVFHKNLCLADRRIYDNKYYELFKEDFMNSEMGKKAKKIVEKLK